MDQFAQLRDRVEEFEKRSTQVFFLLPEEPAFIRQWLRGRDKWTTWCPEYFEPTEKHPWLRSLGSGPDETKCPVLADPSCTTSADYGVVRDDTLGLRNRAATFVIDREGIIRVDSRGDKRFEVIKGNPIPGRPPVDVLLRTIDGFNDP
jgi:alkyl hydroperoxide reductase subunit AhpC